MAKLAERQATYEDLLQVPEHDRQRSFSHFIRDRF